MNTEPNAPLQIHFIDNPEIRFSHALRKEWLEVNHAGGYASSSLLNCNTRKYHGLLVAEIDGLPEKQLLLSSLDEAVIVDDKPCFFSTHQYPGVLHPEGFQYLESFSPLPVTTFTYRIHNNLIRKEILMPQGENAVLIRYSLVEGNAPLELRITPFLAYRNFHHLSKENPFIRDTVETSENGILLCPYEGMPTLNADVSGIWNFAFNPGWYRNFEYIEELERGFDFREDLFAPGHFDLTLSKDEPTILRFTLKGPEKDARSVWAKEFNRRTLSTAQRDNLADNLKHAAGQFIVTHSDGLKNIVAGYHWFLDWGRDAMIALPGLTLYNGREHDCLEILKTYARYEKSGLIPNFINHANHDACYNTVDASLWFIWAAQQYFNRTEDLKAVQQHLWPTILKIFQGYSNGTDFHIKMSQNGLITAGDADTQLTWMDAMVGEKPVTPRFGYAVEINALWYNSLNFIKLLSQKFRHPLPFDKTLIPRVKDSFITQFWSDEKGYLADTVSNQVADFSIRPNQIFAVSLPFSMISEKQAKRILKILTYHLFTPRGIRTLSPSAPAYQGKYKGDGKSRDQAYHNGTVWPWLLGHFGDALMKFGEPAETKRIYKLVAESMKDHIKEAGIASISEVFDGEAPHLPGGCIAQAWSVAELIRFLNMFRDEC